MKLYKKCNSRPYSFLVHYTSSPTNYVIYQYKRIINDEKIKAFLQNLYQYDWDTIKTHQDTNEAYNNSILIFCNIYDTFFPMNKIKIKTKN